MLLLAITGGAGASADIVSETGEATGTLRDARGGSSTTIP